MGNIGRRYLQAISKLSVDYKLFCYDKSQEALNYIPKFCEDNNINTSNINTVNKDNDLYNSINSETLVLIATTAKDRKEILDICIEKMPLTIIAEKPLVQNLSDYNYIMKKAKDYGVDICINFFARAQPFWKIINKELEKKNISLCTILPKNWGIACVGIHHFDLFTWFNGEKDFEFVGSTVNYVFEQKRSGFYDIAGSLSLRTKKGNMLNINSSESPDISSVQIIANNKIYNYFELHQNIIEIEKGKGIKVNSAKERYISNYMTDIIENIVKKNNNHILPDIFESYTPHKMLFEYLNLHNLNDLNIT